MPATPRCGVAGKITPIMPTHLPRCGIPAINSPARADRRVRTLFLCLTLASAACGVGAAEVAAGRQKAQACVVCHGPMGLSTAPDAPNLAGQPAMYLASQLRAFRGGKRTHEVMSVIAKPLSDADIADLAAWYSSIAVEVRRQP